MRRTFTTLMACFLLLAAYAQQTSLRGVILAAQANDPVVGAKITLANQNISTTTNQNGEFALIYLEAIDEEVIIEANGYLTAVK